MKLPFPSRNPSRVYQDVKATASTAAGWASRFLNNARTGAEPALRNSASGHPDEATLVCSEADWKNLRGHLLQPDGLEHVAFLLLGVRTSDSGTDYLLHRVLPVADSDCSRQSAVIIEPNTIAVLNNFASYTESEASVFAHAHSHPFTARPSFSTGDDAYLPGHLESFRGYLESAKSDRPRCFLRLVCGSEEDGFSAEVYDENQKCLHRIGEIRVIGRSGIRIIHNFSINHGNTLPGTKPDSKQNLEHLDRNVKWLGEQGQRRIADQQIAICGLGGIGVEILKHCRGLGFRKFVLIDPDHLEASNLNRLIWSSEDVGKLKVEVAAEFIRKLIPQAEIQIFATKAEEPECEKALEMVDLIVGAVDSDAARLSLQLLAARHLKPMIDLGAGIHLGSDGKTVAKMGGQVCCYIPGGPCLCCQGLNVGAIMDEELREVREAVGYIQGTNESPPSVSTVNSVLAGIAGDLLIRLATGFGEVPLWTSYDMLTHKTEQLDFSKKSNCRICGDEGIEGLGNGTVSPLPPKGKVEDIFENTGSSSLAQMSQNEDKEDGGDSTGEKPCQDLNDHE